MQLRFLSHLHDLNAAEWDALSPNDYPFVKYEFLQGLEATGCVTDAVGWHPQHAVFSEEDQIIAAMPLYFKMHSRGEFVFDQAWANAYLQQGLAYYPKLLCAIPFTPATGPRLLVKNATKRASLLTALLTTLQDLPTSSFHLLFADETDRESCREAGLIERLACHFQWHNANYRDFQDFLDQLTAKKRKNIRQERQHIAKQGLHFTHHLGHEIDEGLWRHFYAFYRDTFDRHWNVPMMTPTFFHRIGAALREQVVMLVARDLHETPVAAALCYRDQNTLYGRHWGSLGDYRHLHFETCYYQGIEYAIQHQIARFDPGVQGEHKISRGFVPTLTYSAHWLKDERFARAVADYCRREAEAVRAYAEECKRHSPYRTAD